MPSSEETVVVRAERNMMGRWGAISYIVGNIIGSGIFITPTSILNNVNSVGASLVVWVVAAGIASLGAFCYVELGTSIRKSGGDFAYLCHVQWNAIAFAFMTCACIFTNPGTMAIQMETFAEYVVNGLKIEFCTPAARFAACKLISFSTILLLVFLNFFSIRSIVARFQLVAMLAKIAAATTIIAVGFFVWWTKGVQSDNFQQPFAHSTLLPGKIALALFAGLFSYDGWDILNYGAEDVRNPQRTMPFAIAVGMSTVALLYIAMNLAYFVVLSVPEVQQSNAVAMTFAGKTLGATFQYAMPFLVCIVLIGSLNATLFAGSRYIWAAGRERHFPAFVSCINRKHDSPRAALLVHALLSIAFSFLGNLEELIGYVAFTHWIIRSFTMLALLTLRFRSVMGGGANRCAAPMADDQAIRVPLLLPICFLGVCLCLVLVTIVQSFWTSIVGLSILACGLGIYTLCIWEGALQRFACYQRAAHLINHAACVIAQIAFNGNIELINDGRNDGGKGSQINNSSSDVAAATANKVNQNCQNQNSLTTTTSMEKGGGTKTKRTKTKRNDAVWPARNC